MTRKAYIPPPGTVPYNAVAWLQKNSPNSEVPTRVLAAGIGADPDSVHGCIAKAVLHGWIVRRSFGIGTSTLWRLGPAAATLTQPAAKPAQKPLSPPGHYTELMRRHNWPPRYQPHFSLERSPGSQYLRIVDLVGGRAAA